MSLDSKCTIASRLAQFLRKNGDKVIDGTCKLSLTTSALCLLNTLFWDMLDDEGRYVTNFSLLQNGEVIEDIQFLYSFMKRTITLKLFHGVQTLRGGVDLTHFSNLTVLELRKIPAHLIIGLDILSERLKALICSRSIYLLKELFVCFMDGPEVIKVWPELRELNLSYNYLESLDQSLKSLPNIEILDLSHNRIRNTDDIKVLKNLCFVNLSFNELEHLPIFSTETCRHLTKLYMRNNNLENLNGLDCLFNLEDLDVSYNLLSEYYVLVPIEKLKSLRVLNLEGNPLFFHNRHTVLVSSFINTFVLNRGLMLNGKLFAVPCMRTETVSDFSTSNNFNHQTSINSVVGNAESTNCVPERRRLLKNHSLASDLEENSVSSDASGAFDESISKKKISKRRNRKKKQREAVISEPVVQIHDDIPKICVEIENLPSHLKAKKIIEARREQRGESWLIPDLNSQNILNPPKVPSNTPVVDSICSQPFIDEDLTAKLVTQISQSPEKYDNVLSSSPKELMVVLDIIDNNVEGSQVVNEVAKDRSDSRESDDIEILSSCSKDHPAIMDVNEKHENLSDCDIYEYQTSTNEDFEENMDSEEESEDSIFFVESCDGSIKKALSVTIGPKYIREKDVIKGKYLEKLDLDSLVCVEEVQKKENTKILNEIHLEFDTIKTSNQKRIYLMENSESSEVMKKILQPFADAKTLKDVTLGALECVKCNSQFSKQAAHKKLLKTSKPKYKIGVLSSSYDSKKEHLEEMDACPNCGNHILVEMETVPLPTIAMPTINVSPIINPSKKMTDHSSDVQSAGSGSSGSLITALFPSLNLSPILKRKSVQDAQVVQSQNIDEKSTTDSTECDDSMNISPSNSMRRNSSDITIISNPSQHSITVMPDLSLEINLNTIIERDSQASLSPTLSTGQTIVKPSSLNKSEEIIDNVKQNFVSSNTINNNLGSDNGEEHDFYSLNESVTEGNNKPANLNEVLSSGSENYQSPHKSTSSSNKSNFDESSRLISILGEKTIVTHEHFSKLDHRLKLHMEISVFSKEEEFEACLETSIVPLSTGDEFKGLFVISTEKFYIFKFLPFHNENLQNNESVEKIIQMIHSCPLNQLKQVKVILGNQGLSIVFRPSSQVYTLVIRDSDICNSFSSLLSDLVQDSRFNFGKVDFYPSTSETLKDIQSSVFSSELDVVPEVLLHLFSFWCNSTVNEKDIIPVCIIVTQDDIYISRIFYKKQESCSDLNDLSIYQYTVVDHQKISDLISFKLKSDLKSVEINFLNESSFENCDGVFWTIKTETKSSLFTFINSVKAPWEEIFKVPLPLTSQEKQSS